MMTKNMYLKMDLVDYHIFINLLANHIRNNFVKYRQFIFIFAQVRTAILFRFLFFSTLYFFFCFIFFVKWQNKLQNGKQKKEKYILLPNQLKENFKKDHNNIIEIFLKMKKFKKRNKKRYALQQLRWFTSP